MPNILLNMGLCYYAEVGGTIYACMGEKADDPSIVAFYQKPSDWKELYPFWVWAILEE